MYLLYLGISASPVQDADQPWTKSPFPNTPNDVSQILLEGLPQEYSGSGKLIMVLVEPSKLS